MHQNEMYTIRDSTEQFLLRTFLIKSLISLSVYFTQLLLNDLVHF